MSKRPARNSLILTGVFLMFMCGVPMDSSAQETQPHLIAPIFPQIGGLESKLYFALVGGGDSRRALPDGTRVPGIQVDEYQESWMNPALSCGADYLPEPNNVIVHHRILSLRSGPAGPGAPWEPGLTCPGPVPPRRSAPVASRPQAHAQAAPEGRQLAGDYLAALVPRVGGDGSAQPERAA